MIEWIIRRSVANRFLVLMGALFLSIWGTWTIINTPVDALPDLSDVQVIIKTSYPGQAPQIVENQVTYPLTTTMLSVPGAKTVRGFSQFGDSYVYVIFEDGTDPYWARSRVLEYLNQVQGKLPAGVSAELGPDATGVGWIYEYALVDRSGKHDLADLRSLQDWFLKYELKTIPDVAEVASVGGVVKEYQVVIDPQRLAQYGISLAEVKSALDASNQEAGGSSIELAEAEYMVRASGYLQTLDDFNHIVLKASENGVPVYLRDVAKVQIGPEMRRGIAELNGEGEVAGGVVILRSGKNAREVIAAVKDKLETLKSSLPEGVEIVTTYDRSQLIDRAIDNLSGKLLEEFIVVAVVCALFLWHVRSALVAIISLPLGLCIAFIVMHFQGLNANIMSLGGIAIAVGAMVDAAIVMIENAHKRLEEWQHQHPDATLDNKTRWQVITDASVEVGPVVAALLFAGRAGSALTAEIGLMRATEQLSSMEMMAVDPLRRVISPRFWAGVISLPLLTVIFVAVGIWGGSLVGVSWKGIDSGFFWSAMQNAVDWRMDLVNCLIKSVVFAITVTWISLFNGYDAIPTSAGISRATTRTVVHSSLAVLGLDFVLTALMFGN